VSASSPLIAAYKGPAGPDVLMFAKLWSQASGRPLRVVTIYPGAAPISMARVDAEWVAYNREEAHDLLDEARSRLGTFDAEFEAIGSDSASHGLHDVQEAAGSDSIVILGSLKTRGSGVRRRATLPTDCCMGRRVQSPSCPGIMKPVRLGRSGGWPWPTSTPRTVTQLSSQQGIWL